MRLHFFHFFSSFIYFIYINWKNIRGKSLPHHIRYLYSDKQNGLLVLVGLIPIPMVQTAVWMYVCMYE